MTLGTLACCLTLCAACGHAVADTAGWPRADRVPFPGMPLRDGPGGGVDIGRAGIVPLADLPDAMRALSSRSVEADSRGWAEVDDEDWMWPQSWGRLVPTWAEASAGVLEVAPVEVRGTVLGAYRFLGMPVNDAHPGEGCASSLRVFERPDAVWLGLMETAYAGMGVVYVAELLNARVGEHPARLVVEKSPSGKVRTSLKWAGARADYTLVVVDDVDHPRAGAAYGRDWLLALARELNT